jgi:hypothetical protein
MVLRGVVADYSAKSKSLLLLTRKICSLVRVSRPIDRRDGTRYARNKGLSLANAMGQQLIVQLRAVIVGEVTTTTPALKVRYGTGPEWGRIGILYSRMPPNRWLHSCARAQCKAADHSSTIISRSSRQLSVTPVEKEVAKCFE